MDLAAALKRFAAVVHSLEFSSLKTVQNGRKFPHHFDILMVNCKILATTCNIKRFYLVARKFTCPTLSS